MMVTAATFAAAADAAPPAASPRAAPPACGSNSVADAGSQVA